MAIELLFVGFPKETAILTSGMTNDDFDGIE